MGITMSHFFKKKPTISYPEQKDVFPAVFRGLHILNRDEQGRERCTACGLCALLPARRKRSPWRQRKTTGGRTFVPRRKICARYEINMLRCIFCGMCEEACPKDAIYLSETFTPANYASAGFIYKKEDLLIPDPKEDPEGYKKALGHRAKKMSPLSP